MSPKRTHKRTHKRTKIKEHIKEKRGKKLCISCECGKTFTVKRNLDRHKVKSCHLKFYRLILIYKLANHDLKQY